MEKNNRIRKVITVYDTAIDFCRASQSDDKTGIAPLSAYIDSRDISAIEPFIIPAELPTYFTIRPLSRELTRRIARVSTNEYSDHELAFQHGVIMVENHVDDGGRSIPSWKPTGISGDRNFITEEELSLFSIAQVDEIGSVIYQLSFLENKSCKRLRLPRTSRELLAAIMV
jgi:hypothetical protein